MSKKKFSGNISGKGYYIALILCAVAIGVSGYLYYRTANNDTQAELQNQITEPAAVSHEEGVEAVATQPAMQEDVPSVQQTEPSVATKPVAVWPVEGQTVMEYAMEALAYNQTTRDWRTHKGVDIAAEAGTAVVAAADGTVYSVYEDDTMGMTVVIVHEGGYATYYASLAETVAVKPGDTVSAGDSIGAVGCTALLESALGDHVHFAVTCNDQSVDPGEFLADAAA